MELNIVISETSWWKAAGGTLCPRDAPGSPVFPAETEPIQGNRSCEGVATWALFPVLIYCSQTAAQVTQGPNSHSQSLSCVSDMNLMRRKMQSWCTEQVATRIYHFYPAKIFGYIALEKKIQNTV